MEAIIPVYRSKRGAVSLKFGREGLSLEVSKTPRNGLRIPSNRLTMAHLPLASLSGKSILSSALDLELDAECKLYQHSLT